MLFSHTDTLLASLIYPITLPYPIWEGYGRVTCGIEAKCMQIVSMLNRYCLSGC